MLFRALNYYDTANKYGLHISGLLFESWWNAIFGYYHVLFEDAKWSEIKDKLFIVSDKETAWEVSVTKPVTVSKDLEYKYRWYALSIYPRIIGFIELVFFTLFLASNHLDYIAWFVGILTAAQWNTWKEDRAVFYTFIIGTLLNITGSYVLAILWV